VIKGFPKVVATSIFPVSPQEFSPGLDTELKKIINSYR
jgi:hypothetical protein